MTDASILMDLDRARRAFIRAEAEAEAVYQARNNTEEALFLSANDAEREELRARLSRQNAKHTRLLIASDEAHKRCQAASYITMEKRMDNSNHARTLRYAQRSRDRLVGDLRREGLMLCTSATVDYQTAQRLHALALRVERIAAVLQVLEECTPEPEPAAGPVPVAPEPQGPRYAVEVSAGAELDVAEWRRGVADYAKPHHLFRHPYDTEGATPAYHAGYTDAKHIASVLIGSSRSHCIEGVAAYAAGRTLEADTEHVSYVTGFRAAHAALQRRLAGGDE